MIDITRRSPDRPGAFLFLAMDAIHISTARKIMNSSEFSISFLTQDAKCRHVKKAVSLKWDFFTGTRTIKALDSGQIRRIRDVLITHINDIPIFI